MDDLISVIIPVYKVEKWLNQCVSSVANQTYKNLEIILVDDGSPDECPRMCDEWKKKDSRVYVLHKRNGGLSDARNAGLEVCTGNWIMFVDGDDFVNQDMIRIALGVAKKNHSDLVAFDYMQVAEDCNTVSEYTSGIYEEKYLRDELLRAFVKTGKGSMVAWNKLYSKELWQVLRFPVGKIHEDEYVIIDILEQVQCATVIDSKLYYYRQRQGSIMSTLNKKGEYDALKAFDLRCTRLKNDKELYQFALNQYLYQLIKIYFIEDKQNRNLVLQQFRKNMKISWITSNWKATVIFILFSIDPFLYRKFVELIGKG